MIALLLCSLALGADEATSDRHMAWYGLPSVGFDTDEGLGGGIWTQLAILDSDFDPYKASFTLQGYAAQSGFQWHRLRADILGLGPGGRGRLLTWLAWRQWPHFGYQGIGNDTTWTHWTGAEGADPLDENYYRYGLRQPFAQALWQQDLDADGRWVAFGALTSQYSMVETFPGSLLDMDAPYGQEGGFSLEGRGGLLLDTRDREIAPHKGFVAEISARGAPSIDGEAGGYYGPMGTLRAYVPLGGRVTLASRLMAERLFGQVPFYEMIQWGGSVLINGFGGFDTLRGVSIGRWRGPGKAVGNLEARIRVFDLKVFKKSLAGELAPFGDAGTTFGIPNSPFLIHPAGGLGGRLILDETFVGRLDVGYGADPVIQVDEEGATEATEAHLGFYLVFDHPY